MIEMMSERSWGWLRPVAWGGAALLLLLPLLAMRFAPEAGVDWTVGDFVIAGLMLGTVGLALELVVRMSRSWYSRIGGAVALAAGLLLVWANGAVGYIGSEDNPYNLVFFGVILVALAGSAIARFRAGGMAWAMLAAALAHAAAGLGGLSEDPVTGPITAVFVGMWLVSAWLFRKAAATRG
jgi:hypothetical protein